jgi:hypothetical protein
MFGDNNEEKVFGYGKIAITTDHSISKVLLIDSLDYNLLFVSQLCEMSYNYLFTSQAPMLLVVSWKKNSILWISIPKN